MNNNKRMPEESDLEGLDNLPSWVDGCDDDIDAFIKQQVESQYGEQVRTDIRGMV